MTDERLERLTRIFETLGADDPGGWAASELEEDIPQLARFLFLRSLWQQAINLWETDELEHVPAAQRLLAAGADRADLVRLARHASYAAIFQTLYRLDEGPDPDLAIDGLPGWVLAETVEADDAGNLAPTGRVVGGLYEDMLTMDPSGRDGQDLWQ